MSDDIRRIAQEVFDRCLCKRTRAAARAITRFYDEELRSTGLRPSQVELLVAIAAQSELSISGLANALHMDRTTTTRNLRPLEERGLVTLSPERRHRMRLARLTSSGEAALANSVDHWKRAQAKMERRLHDEGVASVRTASSAILSAARITG